MILIRRWQATDLPAILEIEKQTQRYPWTATMLADCLENHYQGLVMEDTQAIIGFSIWNIAAEEAQLLNISIDPVYQRRGYGQQLLESVIQSTRSQAVKLFLEVRNSNQTALNLYYKLGFEEIGRRKNYYPHPAGREDARVLALTL